MHMFKQGGPIMKALRHLALLFLLPVAVAFAPACATTTTTSTTWTDPAVAGYGRTGSVQTVQEVVQRTEGNPAGGAIAGALIGGFLFGGGRGPAAIAGAAGGAAVGAAASSGSAEQRTYQVMVRFDDGAFGEFVYGGFSPFRPGERVVVTPNGLARAG
jgi:outer membrane lipoprotein SlyB